MQGFDVASINTLPANDIALSINDHFIKAADETVTKTKYCKTSWRCWYWNDECTKYKHLYWQALTKCNDMRYLRRETRPIMKAAKAVTFETAKREAWGRIVHKLKYIRGQPNPRRHPDPLTQPELLATEFAGRTNRNNLPDIVLNELNNLAPIRENIVENAMEKPDLIHDQDFTMHEL